MDRSADTSKRSRMAPYYVNMCKKTIILGYATIVRLGTDVTTCGSNPIIIVA